MAKIEEEMRTALPNEPIRSEDLPGDEGAATPDATAAQDHVEIPDGTSIEPSTHEPGFKPDTPTTESGSNTRRNLIAGGIAGGTLALGGVIIGAAVAGDGDGSQKIQDRVEAEDPSDGTFGNDLGNPSETVITVAPEQSAGAESEILHADELPESLLQFDPEIEIAIQRVIKDNDPIYAETTTPEDRNLFMWRGVVEFNMKTDDGEDLYVMFHNPLEVIVDDPTGEHDQLALWVGYHAPSQRFLGIERGYRDGDDGSRYNNGAVNNGELRHWSVEANPHSGQLVSGKPREVVNGIGIKVTDNQDAILRSSEFKDVFSTVQVFTDVNDATNGLYDIHDLTDETVRRDINVAGELAEEDAA